MFDDRRRLFHFELDEDGVVTDVATAAQLFQRQEAWIAEPDAAPRRVPGGGIPAGRVPGCRRSLELPTGGTRHKTLDHVPAPVAVLVVEDDRDGQSERPVEQRVVVTGNDPDVDGQVRSLAGSAAARKQRRSQSISVG